jgi:PAS domain S-box-containing protein
MRIVMPTISELQQQLAKAREHLDIIKMVTEELVTELDFDKLVVSIAEKAREIIQAETLVIPIINSEANAYTYKAAIGKNAPSIINQTFPISVGMCGWVLSNKKSLIFAKDLPWLMDEKTSWEEGMESALLVPLVARGEIVGGLSGLGKQEGRSFTQEDYDLLTIFANQISIAIDNARAFKALSEEKERTEITLSSIGDAVITTDMQGSIVRVNAVACELLGRPAAELINKPLTSVFDMRHIVTGEPVEDPVSRVISSGEMVSMKDHVVLSDRNGREYQIVNTAAPIRLDDGEILGVVLVFRDVTEENNLLADLRESELRHRRLIEHLGNEYFMFVQNANGQFVYVSPSVVDCLGYSPQDYIQNYRSFLTENKFNNVIQEKLDLALEGVRSEPYEVEINNKQGDACWLRISETPIIDEEGNVIAIDGLVQNISKQRELEMYMRQSQKMQAVGQLSGGIAHDFNNQLGVVMGYLEKLQLVVSEEPEQTRWVLAASKASERCVELTKSLLDFSCKKKITQSIVNVNNSLSSMQSMIEHSITANIDFKLQLDPDLFNIVIDEGEFQDVILNLIINARDAMPEGGELSVLTENISLQHEQSYFLNSLKPGDYIKVSIVDSGLGMSEQVLERIFEPFFTTKPVGVGTGLGMPMVFGFINRVNGAVDVRTGEAKGTCIELYIPKTSGKKSLEIKSEKRVLPQGNEKVLLVEDESALRFLAEEYLKNLGYEVYSTENASEALNVLTSNAEIDLLFSDVVMPGGIDGYQLVEKARQLRPSIKVLLATGYASQEQAKQNTAEEVADVILYKPYSQSILAQRIRRVLDL